MLVIGKRVKIWKMIEICQICNDHVQISRFFWTLIQVLLNCGLDTMKRTQLVWNHNWNHKPTKKCGLIHLTIDVGCLFSWGLTMWGALHSSLMLYEANDVQEAMMVHNRILILVSPFQQPRKQVWSVQIWKTMTTITLWALWKCRCNRRYDATYQCLLDVLHEIWENLVAIVRG